MKQQQTQIVPLTASEARLFATQYGLCGQSEGDIRIGLTGYDGKLLTLLTAERSSTTLTILSYIKSDTLIRNSFTILLQHLQNTYTPTRIYAVSDNSMSTETLYTAHKFNYLRTEKPTVEKRENFYIWDSGKTVMVKDLT